MMLWTRELRLTGPWLALLDANISSHHLSCIATSKLLAGSPNLKLAMNFFRRRLRPSPTHNEDFDTVLYCSVLQMLWNLRNGNEDLC